MKVSALSKLNQVAAIVPPPPMSIINPIKYSLARFINTGSYDISNRELVFTEEKYSGYVISNFQHHIQAIQASWLRKHFSSKAFCLTLLVKNISTSHNRDPNQLFFFGDQEYSYMLTLGNIHFLSNVSNVKVKVLN